MDVFEEQRQGERRKALRTLLQHPLVTADGPHGDQFVLIRRHGDEINRWLGRGPGWGLYVDSETARLRKSPVEPKDHTRGAESRDKKFSRLRYCLFCLAVAALGQGERQTTLGKLFESILRMAGSDPILTENGFVLDPKRRDHRRDLVAAVRKMMELGLLRQIDGDEEAFLSQRGDVLYTVNRSALAWVLNLRRSPSTVEAQSLDERMAAITAEPQPQTHEGRNNRIRRYLYRKLLDDPILYLNRLDEDTRQYLSSQRPKIVQEIENYTGLRGEIRSEGIAMVDEQGDLTDFDIPREGTEGHICLLLAELLAEHLITRGVLPLGHFQIEREMLRKNKSYGRYWRKNAREPEAFKTLIREAVYRLQALDLIEVRNDGIVPLPAIARYRLEKPRISGEDSL